MNSDQPSPAEPTNKSDTRQQTDNVQKVCVECVEMPTNLDLPIIVSIDLLPAFIIKYPQVPSRVPSLEPTSLETPSEEAPLVPAPTPMSYAQGVINISNSSTTTSCIEDYVGSITMEVESLICSTNETSIKDPEPTFKDISFDVPISNQPSSTPVKRKKVPLGASGRSYLMSMVPKFIRSPT